MTEVLTGAAMMAGGLVVLVVLVALVCAFPVASVLTSGVLIFMPMLYLMGGGDEVGYLIVSLVGLLLLMLSAAVTGDL